jgi:hypothetical protein
MTDHSNLAGLLARVDEIPDATDEQWDAARAYVARTAPDCADVLFGIHETRDNDQRVRLERGLRGVR